MFILVYRLAMDAKAQEGDGVADRKYPSLLEDFQTSTKSMARKRHLASIARGLFGFCLAPRNRFKKFKKFKGSKDIRLMRSIRGRKRTYPVAYGVAHDKKMTTNFMLLG